MHLVESAFGGNPKQASQRNAIEMWVRIATEFVIPNDVVQLLDEKFCSFAKKSVPWVQSDFPFLISMHYDLIRIINMFSANDSESVRLAVLMTCFNRKDTTLNCLLHLFSADPFKLMVMDVYLVDDGSSDGTTSAVKEKYPSVQIIRGDGTLFWGGGMYTAFKAASKCEYDFYLWLNDDTVLYRDALKTLLLSYYRLLSDGKNPALVVGCIQDPITHEFSYGGHRQISRWSPLKFSSIQPNLTLQSCDTMNGNCVLISNSTLESIGLIDPKFSHYAGDFDYGLRARQFGYSLWISPHYVGTCCSNRAEREFVGALGLRESIQKLLQPKGLTIDGTYLHPFLEWQRFTQKHSGPCWPFFWLSPYRRVLWKILKDKFNIVVGLALAAVKLPN